MIAISRTDTSLLGHWWWTVDRWSLGALGLLMSMGVVLVVAALVIGYAVYGISRPLKRMIFVMCEFARGNYTTAIPRGGTDEIGEMAQALDVCSLPRAGEDPPAAAGHAVRRGEADPAGAAGDQQRWARLGARGAHAAIA